MASAIAAADRAVYFFSIVSRLSRFWEMSTRSVTRRGVSDTTASAATSSANRRIRGRRGASNRRIIEQLAGRLPVDVAERRSPLIRRHFAEDGASPVGEENARQPVRAGLLV